MSDTEIVKGFFRSIRAGLHWLLHIVLLPVIWLVDGVGKGLGYVGTWVIKIGSDIAKIGADLDAL